MAYANYSVHLYVPRCLILDYARKGEGAADLQASFGDMDADFNGKALSCILDDATLSQLQQ